MSIEERKNAACAVSQHCERMYAETGNPYYVLDALYADYWGDFTPDAWALGALLKAVSDAMRKHHETGERISIDAALGLSLSRGETPRERAASRHDVEVSAFRLVRVIHACFAVSIPDACEIVYYAVDRNFATGCEETLWRPHGAVSLPHGLTRTQFDEIEAHYRADSKRRIRAAQEPQSVKTKMQNGKWWTVTRGDRLGYSLDQFIDRYYREGTRQKAEWGKWTGKSGLFFKGHSLLLIPEECTRSITLADCDGYRLRAASALATLPRRPDFEQFEVEANARIGTVRKPNISAQ